jgi:hypothetical protein
VTEILLVYDSGLVSPVPDTNSQFSHVKVVAAFCKIQCSQYSNTEFTFLVVTAAGQTYTVHIWYTATSLLRRFISRSHLSPYIIPSMPILLQDLALLLGIFKIMWNVQIQMNSSTSIVSTKFLAFSVKILTCSELCPLHTGMQYHTAFSQLWIECDNIKMKCLTIRIIKIQSLTQTT